MYSKILAYIRQNWKYLRAIFSFTIFALVVKTDHISSYRLIKG